MCMAKWLWSSIHLTTGLTNSCFLPPLHKIDADEVEVNPKALHNTAQKKKERAAMLCGDKPEGCSTCWRVEAMQGDHLSDRFYRSSEPWAQDGWDDVISKGADGDIEPRYLEVNFNHACNLACSYCSPHLSSKWSFLRRHKCRLFRACITSHDRGRASLAICAFFCGANIRGFAKLAKGLC